MIVLAGLGGPLLGVLGRSFVPVVVGEILAGVLVGPAVLGAVHPAGATVSFLGEIGFAMLMLTVGMHLPLRDRRLAAPGHGGPRRSTPWCSPPARRPCCCRRSRSWASRAARR